LFPLVHLFNKYCWTVTLSQTSKFFFKCTYKPFSVRIPFRIIIAGKDECLEVMAVGGHYLLGIKCTSLPRIPLRSWRLTARFSAITQCQSLTITTYTQSNSLIMKPNSIFKYKIIFSGNYQTFMTR